MYRENAEKLLDFIQKSPTAFHAVEEMSLRFRQEGFEELKENTPWNLKKGGRYFVTRNHSALIAFSVPETDVRKFHIIASHS